jgi:hypothetical protein
VRLFRRKRVFVDRRVQGALLLRIVLYWFVSLVAFVQLLFCWKIATGPAGPSWDDFRLDLLWEEHASLVLASVTMLPFILLDALMMSNRFAGPFHRIRRSIHELAAGQSVEPLQFRKKDHWQDVAQDVNALNEYIEQLKKQLASPLAGHPSQLRDDEHDWEPAAAQ